MDFRMVQIEEDDLQDDIDDEEIDELEADDTAQILPGPEAAASSSHSWIPKNDWGNIGFLLFIYLLQGIPLGLAHSLPFILSSRKVSYADQGTFSFAFWPFSLKLLWA